MGSGSTIVVDIGKTLSKVTLWSSSGELLDRAVRPNQPQCVDGIKRLDVQGVGDWLIETLATHAGKGVSAIIPVGHGAAVAAVADDQLAFAPLDYEQPIPDDVLRAYRRERDDFALTGSPALPGGLNIGSQLFWLDRLYPEIMPQATLVPWAQYWAWFLSGKAASEVTSLGCHSDLWLPADAAFSSLAQRMDWASRFAPLADAAAPIGPLRPDIARRTGLGSDIAVLAGLHDSNAALLAARGFDEIADREATVLSTGTWFIAMRLAAQGSAAPQLPPGRDCLINVDVRGRTVPSARFMGGREIESVIGIDTRRVDIKPDQPALLDAAPRVVARDCMLLPTLAPGNGPFPAGEGRWINPSDDWIERRAAACLYAALVADAALDLIGSSGSLLVEGRFAEAEVFVAALAALRPETRVYTANAHNDVSFGALRLINPGLKPQGELRRVAPLGCDLGEYRTRWCAETSKGT